MAFSIRLTLSLWFFVLCSVCFANPKQLCLQDIISQLTARYKAPPEVSLHLPTRISVLEKYRKNDAILEFKRRSRLLFSSNEDGVRNGSFHASNEFDWYKSAPDNESTDVVLGFGTNSAWDIAVQKNAKKLIIGDWDLDPLIGQEFLIRPLLKKAKSRLDFLEMLTGIEIPSHLEFADIKDIFNHIDSTIHAIPMISHDVNSPLFKARVALVEKNLERFASDPEVGDMELKTILSYYRSVLRRQIEDPLDSFQTRGYEPFVGQSLSFISKDPIQKMAGPYFSYFNRRYNPTQMRYRGASAIQAQKPSVFSSEENFFKLKKLFENVQYVHSSFDDPKMFEVVRKQNEDKSFTLSISNILDFSNQEESSYMKAATNALGSRRHPLTIYQTKGTKRDHQYDQFKFEKEN